MASQKKRNKRYIPKLPDTIKLKMQPWKVRAVMAPLESILDQLENEGTIDVAGSDVAVFKDLTDGHWYDSAAALMGVVEAYEIHEIRSGRQLNMEPMRQLAKKLEYGMPIFDSDTKSVRECLARMKAETLEMTAGYARDLIKDFQIKEELEKVGA